MSTCDIFCAAKSIGFGLGLLLTGTAGAGPAYNVQAFAIGATVGALRPIRLAMATVLFGSLIRMALIQQAQNGSSTVVRRA